MVRERAIRLASRSQQSHNAKRSADYQSHNAKCTARDQGAAPGDEAARLRGHILAVPMRVRLLFLPLFSGQQEFNNTNFGYVLNKLEQASVEK